MSKEKLLNFVFGLVVGASIGFFLTAFIIMLLQ
jgi:hypothetical protein